MGTSVQSAVNCWAAPLGDCDQKITREHTVSQCLFESDTIMVQGFSWCLNEPKSIGLANLVAKILCKRHNSGLSELDAAALHAFNVFRETIRLNQVREKMKRPAIHWNVKRMVIDGPLLERWFLKTLINLSFGGEWPICSNEKGVPAAELVEVAFGKRQFEDGAGLYLAARAGEHIDSMDRFNLTPMTNEEDKLVAGRFNFRGYTFFLSLIPEKFDKLGDADLLHRDATINCNVKERLSHVIQIKGWPKSGGQRPA